MKKYISIRNLISCVIPAFFFAAFMVLGESFYKDNSWDLVFGSPELLKASILQGIGYFLLFSVGIAILFHLLDWLSERKHGGHHWPQPVRFYLRLLHRHPIATTFFTLLILYLPYMIYSFPGILTSDTVAQLENSYAALLAGTSRLKNHHPVVHTLLLYGFTRFGEFAFHSANIGLGLFALVQICFLFFSISWLMQFLLEHHVSARCLGLVLLFYVLAPRMRNYMFLLVKDTWFAWISSAFPGGAIPDSHRTELVFCREMAASGNVSPFSCWYLLLSSGRCIPDYTHISCGSDFHQTPVFPAAGCICFCRIFTLYTGYFTCLLSKGFQPKRDAFHSLPADRPLSP